MPRKYFFCSSLPITDVWDGLLLKGKTAAGSKKGVSRQSSASPSVLIEKLEHPVSCLMNSLHGFIKIFKFYVSKEAFFFKIKEERQ